MSKVIDLVGERYGRLVLLKRYPNYRKRNSYYLCVCDCGFNHFASMDNIRSGAVASCGCLRKERMTTHGSSDYSKNKLYTVWQNMKSRCRGYRERDFRRYTNRRIDLCKEWETFSNFRDWAVVGYREDLRIDRINNDKGYCPENCRWVTPRENSNNRQNTILINGEPLSFMVDRLGVPYHTLRYRFRTGRLT
jgi:hypothetical protein